MTRNVRFSFSLAGRRLAISRLRCWDYGRKISKRIRSVI